MASELRQPGRKTRRQRDEPDRRRRAYLFGAVAVGVIVLLTAAGALAMHVLGGREAERAPLNDAPVAVAPAPIVPTPAPTPAPVTPPPPRAPVERPPDPPPPAPMPEVKPPMPEGKPPMPEAKPPMPVVPPIRAEANVNRAIERGLAHLKQRVARTNRADIRFGRFNVSGVAESALIGLTLLECGVPAEDKQVQELATAVRAEQATLMHTYALALGIIFLDRLAAGGNDPALIQAFALRLAAGQSSMGAWSYGCPVLTEAEEKKFADYLRANAPSKGMSAGREVNADLLPPRLKNCGVARWRRGAKPPSGIDWLASGDNSNAQFALLALWIAQRHGAPIQASLAFVDHYFRHTTLRDGGWGYSPPSVRGPDNYPATAAMTCAGLLALAVGHGLAIQIDDPNRVAVLADPAITRGFASLERRIKTLPLARPTAFGALDTREFYLYWSIERVAVMYDRQIIGDKDWYAWMSRRLVELQQADGGWDKETYNDCFALLILRRVNIAKDLTASLKTSLDQKEKKKD
ncbi:hypothetical protein AYO40_04565 [Planctomycetaceae bacterium SCGC AG-212-D15]|nr:hypothetical protein AYO40_04565 [Planctomycetaceae bacterium SCGC AG-212-D15]